MPDSRKLSVFLCHASQDKPAVRELRQRLLAEGWIDPWLDEEKLLPGQDWDLEIKRAVEASDAVIVCISSQSISKEGYVQKELRKVLDLALEKPEGTIFIIPLRLDECEPPASLKSWHYVDYFPEKQRDVAYERLLKSLKLRIPKGQESVLDVPLEEKRAVPVKPVQGNIEVGWLLPLLFYFLLVVVDVFLPSSDDVEYLMGAFALLAGVSLVLRRKIPNTILFKISLTIFLFFYGMGYRVEDFIPFAPSVIGVAALISAGLWAVTFRKIEKTLLYTSIFLASFLLFVGVYEILSNIVYSDFTTLLGTFILVSSLITSVTVWLDL